MVIVKGTETTLALYGGSPVRRQKMPTRRALGKAEISALISVIRHYRERDEDPPYQGPFEERFCQAFTEFMGGGFADAVATGTLAVYVALAALELPPRSEVIISPVTDSGPLNCLILQGFVPVVADSAPNNYNMGVEQFLSRITPRTSALLAVHCAGEPLEIDRIVAEAHRRGIRVIEDCSQAPGALWKNQKVGSFGDMAAFSTMYRKALMTGPSGGVVYTKNHALYEKALAYADRGKPIWRKDLDLRNPGHALFPALNMNSNEFSCAIGLASLSRLQDTIDRRIEFVYRLIELMQQRSTVCKPYALHRGSSPFFFPIFVDTHSLACSKMNFARAVAAEGIPLGPHYGCVVSSWDWAKPYLSDDFVTQNALDTRDRSFNLFLNERYRDGEAHDIVEALAKVERHFLKKTE